MKQEAGQMDYSFHQELHLYNQCIAAIWQYPNIGGYTASEGNKLTFSELIAKVSSHAHFNLALLNCALDRDMPNDSHLIKLLINNGVKVSIENFNKALDINKHGVALLLMDNMTPEMVKEAATILLRAHFEYGTQIDKLLAEKKAETMRSVASVLPQKPSTTMSSVETFPGITRSREEACVIS